MNAVDADCLGTGEFVRRAMALRASEGNVEALSRWTSERIKILALPGAKQYGKLLVEDSVAGRRERELGIRKFTTGESYFYRDQGQFDLLATTILPELIERRADQRKLRLWSAGCAAGEEAYSLAMLVDELSPRLTGWDVQILGTDINSDALEKARRGTYGEWSFRALDAKRKQRYFRPSGKQWQIDTRLRDMVTFRSGDLVRDRFPDADANLHDFDLILCRNVFIYLDTHAVSQVTAEFTEALGDGGYLVTGHSELFGHDTAPLRVRMFAQSVVFQKTEHPAAATDLGEALAKAHVAFAAPLRPSVPIERQQMRTEQRAIPALPPVAPGEDCDHLMQTAWRYADHGMPGAAEENCRKAIAIAAFDPRPYYLLAQLAQERGDAESTKTLLKKVIYLDPSSIAAYLELGALHAQAGDHNRARRMYESASRALRKLPAQAAVAPYSESAATDVLAYVERLLGGPAGEAAVSAAEQARSRQSG